MTGTDVSVLGSGSGPLLGRRAFLTGLLGGALALVGGSVAIAQPVVVPASGGASAPVPTLPDPDRLEELELDWARRRRRRRYRRRGYYRFRRRSRRSYGRRSYGRRRYGRGSPGPSSSPASAPSVVGRPALRFN